MKTPAIQLYTGDILKEGSFTCLSLAAQGLWMRMLLIMHDSCKRGFLLNAKGMQMSCKQLARIVGANEDQVSQLISEMEEAGTFSRDLHSTIYNRRMVREEGGRASIHQVRSEAAKKRWQEQEPCKGDANGECKTDAKHAASSSSSSSIASSTSVENTARANGNGHHRAPDPDFDVWAEAAYQRHTKKADKFLALKALHETFAGHPQLQRTFDKHHEFMCKTPEWREKHGRFAPRLHEWITNDGWRSPPEESGSNEPEGIRYLRELANGVKA